MNSEELAQWRGGVDALINSQSKLYGDVADDLRTMRKDLAAMSNRVNEIEINFKTALAKWSVIMSILGAIAYTLLQKVIH